ncbi:MAG: SlyX family protein [Chromatocurvus sp.]
MYAAFANVEFKVNMENANITRAELERLQTEQAYQSDTIRALNDALSAQQMELIELRHHMRLLETRLREILADSAREDSVEDSVENSAENAATEPPPPHY